MIVYSIRNLETESKQAQIKLEKPQKASWLSLPMKHKFTTFVSLVSLVTFMLPHQTFASVVPARSTPTPLVFVIGSRIVYLDTTSLQLDKLYAHKHMQEEVDRQLELNTMVRNYLTQQGSPLAAYTSTLLQLNNWKKIIALSNAESGMCKHYPVTKANCWGIGGSNLWFMGSNLGEGIVSMNHFLNTYPNSSQVKYSQMSFKQMNGLYKQPPAKHWVDNNQIIYDALTAIENSL
jgi:hypothetical protein